MKILFVLRHGKAEGHSGAGDFARKLTLAGEADAAQAGNSIAENTRVLAGDEAVSTALLVSSDALRASSTAQIVANAFVPTSTVLYDHGIYDASAGDLLDIVRSIPNQEDIAVVVGHNPGLEDLISTLSDDMSRTVGLSPASYAQMELDVDSWVDVNPGCGQIVFIFVP